MSDFCIISSYDDLCGIASYTKSLKKEFELQGQAVDIIDLDQEYFHSSSSLAKKIADRRTDDICSILKNYDKVNIQFEFGIFGDEWSDITRRFTKILNACKNKKLILTLHTIPQVPRKGFYYRINPFSNFKDKFNELLSNIRTMQRISLLKSAVKFCIKNNGFVIVHNNREKKVVENLLGEESSHIVAYPLCFHVDKNDFANLSSTSFKESMGIDEYCKIIGLFGFLAPYKDFVTPVKALNFLSEEYVVCIFGGQHPSSIKSEGQGSTYEKILLNECSDILLKDRVFFIGAISDEDKFSAYMSICDYIVLPYHEIGQSGSGVASLAIEINPAVYLSRTLAFFEIGKYFKDSFTYFDIGNYIELAQKIQSNEWEQRKGREAALSVYNSKNLVEIYLKCLK